MIKLYTSILFTCFCQLIFAQEKVHTIPFQLTEYNNLSVQAVLNERDTVHLMFHTAANFVTLTEDAVLKLKSITFQTTTDSIKSWGGSINSARLVNAIRYK